MTQRLHGAAAPVSAAICAACALVTAVAAGLPSAIAAVGSPSGWQPVETVARSGYLGDPQLVTDAAGNAVAVWEGADGNVYGSFRDPAERRWGRRLLLAKGPSRGRSIHGFALVADKRNGAVLITSSARLTARFADLARRRWSPARVLGRNPIGRPVAAVDSAGNATAVWLRRGPKSAWFSARGSVRTGRWSAPVAIASAAMSEPQLSVARDGGVTVLWVRCVETRPARCGLARPMQSPELRRYRLELRRRSPAGSWTPVVKVRTVSLTHLLGTRGQRAVFSDADGGVTVAWIDDARRIVASTLRAGARSWSSPALLARPRDDCSFDAGPSWPTGGMLRASVNAGGDALIAWVCSQRDRDQVGALTRRAGASTWSPLNLPSEVDYLPTFGVAIGDDRTAFLTAVVLAEGDRERLVGAVHPPGVDSWSLTDLQLRRFDGAYVVTGPSGIAVAFAIRDLNALDAAFYWPESSG
jgi:hypothetical protein